MSYLSANTVSVSEDNIGMVRIDCVSVKDSRPIENVTVNIFNTKQPDSPIETVSTDIIGRTPVVTLSAPDLEYSLQPSQIQPYETYNIVAMAPDYETVEIKGVEILPGQLAIQNIRMLPMEQPQEGKGEVFVIPPHTLYGDYPSKIPEDEMKPVNESGEIVLSKVVIPEYVIVHDGAPSDTSAKNYYVKYKDYIKNVASSEIYSTWPEATIIANILAIQSFCLNRIYTEWYRNKGYNFTISTSTAYDQKYIHGRNIYETIDRLVDQMFTNYLARPDIAQPILTQYCDGKNVSCPKWMTQWGSKDLGDDGYTAVEIIRHFYGDNMYIATAEEVSGVPSSWEGNNLEIGSSGNKVRQLQTQLNGISKGYPLIPKIAQDGVYGSATADAVKTFQKIFNLSQTGTVDVTTWYKISEIYVGVSRIAELV